MTAFLPILTAELLLLFRLWLNDFLAWAESRYREDHRAHRERFSIYGASTGAGEGSTAEARITGLVAHHDAAASK
jgi:hypothetical protein